MRQRNHHPQFRRAEEHCAWSAEEPTLYELTVLVVGHDGPLVEKIVQRIGFRTFRIEDGIMKLNGKRVVFKGATATNSTRSAAAPSPGKT